MKREQLYLTNRSARALGELSDMEMYRIFVMTFSHFKFILFIEIMNQEIQKFNKSKKIIISVAEVLKESKLLNQLRSPHM